MELKYADLYQEHYKKYSELLEKYENLITSSEYKSAIYNTSFDFLRTLYLAQRVDLYVNSENGEKPLFKFTSAQDALSTYYDLINFKTNTSVLLDKAALICQAKAIADKINNFILLSDYLSDDLMIKGNEKLEHIAKECLNELPTISKEINPELRIAILTDIVNQFNENQITQLTSKQVFKPTDIDNLVRLTISDNGKNNIKKLCSIFNLELTPIKSCSLKLKGTSFNTDEGVNRQENIKNLKEYFDLNGNVPALTVKPFTFTPEIGNPEPAVRILWGDKDLGFLPKDVAETLHNEYKYKVIAAKLNKVVGGGSVLYGVEITLDICENAKDLDKSKLNEEIEK